MGDIFCHKGNVKGGRLGFVSQNLLLPEVNPQGCVEERGAISVSPGARDGCPVVLCADLNQAS